jgi:hypothetical protein
VTVALLRPRKGPAAQAGSINSHTGNIIILNSSVFWDVTQTLDPLKMGPIGNPETSVFNQTTLRNIKKTEESR